MIREPSRCALGHTSWFHLKEVSFRIGMLRQDCISPVECLHLLNGIMVARRRWNGSFGKRFWWIPFAEGG